MTSKSMFIVIEVPEWIADSAKKDLETHIRSLCRLLADEALKVEVKHGKK